MGEINFQIQYEIAKDSEDRLRKIVLLILSKANDKSVMQNKKGQKGFIEQKDIPTITFDSEVS